MKTLKDVLNENNTMSESILDDPNIAAKDLSDVVENPFKYLARLGPEVWADKNKIREEFELFRLAITKECKIKPGDKATGAKNKIAFDLDSQYGPSIWVKEGPYSKEIHQSYPGKYGRYLDLRDVGKSYAAHHFRGRDVYIPSKKLVDQYIEFKVVMRRALTVFDGIYDMEAIKEYIK
jgi:hypothetical protein